MPFHLPSGQHYQFVDLLLWLWYIELDLVVNEEFQAQVVSSVVQLVCLRETESL